MNTSNSWLVAGAALSGLAVLFGAFGAHALEGRLTTERLETYEIAVRYQMYHGLALVLLSVLKQNITSDLLNYAGYGFLLGTIIFSGSLYILVLTDTSWLGAITPVGGLSMIFGWILLVYVAVVEGRT